MGYVDKIIRPNETVIAIGRMHWIVYLPGATLSILGFVLVLVSIGAGDGRYPILLAGTAFLMFGVWLS